MAEDNIKNFATEYAVTGLLMLALIAFASIFLSANNPTGLSSEENAILSITYNNLSSGITAIEEDGNSVLTVAADTDPTESALGSKDTVSTSFTMFGAGKRFYNSTKLLIAWIFAGTVGQMLLALFSGLIGITATYLIYRAIKGY